MNRMNFLWQQILSFLAVILIAFTISAVSLSEYMTKQVLTDAENQLLNYGQNIISNNFSREDMNRADQLLASENIYIRVYMADGRVIYPTYRQEYQARLSETELETLAAGDYLPMRMSSYLDDTGQTIQLATVYLPLTAESVGFPAGFISLSEPLINLSTKQDEVQQRIYWSFTAALIIAVLLSVVYALYQTRKINRLQQATKEIASGHYDIEVDTSGKDEFGDLARDFKRMADALLESQEEINRQEGLRRQFMLDAAHEMRTPLTTMNGLLEGLQLDMIPFEARERSIELIHKETQRLIRLVNENLDYEKIRSRQIVLKQQMLSVDKLLQQIQVQMQDKAASKGNTIRVDCPVEIKVWADYDRIIQILMNLVNNAIQFSQDSPIDLKAYGQEHQVIIQVIDQGIGIDASQIRSIWERFYKVDVSRKNTQFGESGIGLAVVHSLVEAHGGTIKVESELGQGSIFTISLPILPTKEEIGHD